MKVQIVAGLLAALVLSGCQSRYNPANWGWFGGSRSVTTLAPRDGYTDTTDYRPLVGQVLSMEVQRVPGGAIVTAVGLPPTQGYWETDLVSTYQTITGDTVAKDGDIRLEFKIIPPLTPQPVVNQQSREVMAGTFLSDQTLGGVRSITVVGAQNSRTSSR